MGSRSVWEAHGYPRQWVSQDAENAWQKSMEDTPEEEWSDGPERDGGLCTFPDMSSRKNVARGSRSGMISIYSDGTIE